MSKKAKKLQMSGFKPGFSDVGSDISTNWATNTAQTLYWYIVCSFLLTQIENIFQSYFFNIERGRARGPLQFEVKAISNGKPLSTQVLLLLRAFGNIS